MSLDSAGWSQFRTVPWSAGEEQLLRCLISRVPTTHLTYSQLENLWVVGAHAIQEARQTWPDPSQLEKAWMRQRVRGALLDFLAQMAAERR